MIGRDPDTYDMFAPPERGRFGEDEHEASSRDKDQDVAILDLDLALHAETHAGQAKKGALRVSDDGNDAHALWLPKSLVTFETSPRTISGKDKAGNAKQYCVVKVAVPQWLAEEKGLL